MASAFGHAVAAVAIGSAYPKRMTSVKFWVMGIVCAILPDADVLAFSFGIPYESFWGHRGFSHSLVFALLFGLLVTVVMYRKELISKTGLGYILFFALCTASHGLLDGLTTGGRGVAYFSPFNNGRYFLPWRMIRVSPIGIADFFGTWGIRVLKSEFVWIGIPSIIYIFATSMYKLIKKQMYGKEPYDGPDIL